MPRPAREIKRPEVLVRFDPALLKAVDDWPGVETAKTRTDKLHLLIGVGLRYMERPFPA